MSLDLPATLGILTAALAVWAFAYWRARQPPNPEKVRMINYHVVQILTIVVLLLMAAHLVTLMTGRPLAGVAS